MCRETDATAPGHLSPEMLTELEGLVGRKLGARVLEFRLSVRDAGLVVTGRARSHHAKQLALQALMDMTAVVIRSNEIEVYESQAPRQFVNDRQNGEKHDEHHPDDPRPH